MKHFPAFLRSTFIACICLALAPWVAAASPSHAQRYPDAMVASVWMPDGQRWIRLEQVAPGYYHGSVEFESGGWMAAYEYYEFTCLLTVGETTAPLQFHHEFRVAPGEASMPSEFWASLSYDWSVGFFRDTEDFAAVFVDPVGTDASASAGFGVGLSGTAASAPKAPTPSALPVLNPPPAGGASTGGSSAPSPVSPYYGPSVFGPDGYDINGYDRNGYDRQGYDHQGYDSAGWDRLGFDRNGYDTQGYDRNGVDRQGFDRQGVYQGDFDAEGYDSTGFDHDGYDRDGYDHNGRNREGYDREGYDPAGRYRIGGGFDGQDQPYAVPNADGSPARDARGFDSTGLHANGTYYDDFGYDLSGYDAEGYDANGYDSAGFDVFGFNVYGYDATGYDASGFDQGGRDAAGYDREGRNRRGFNRDGIHSNHTLYDDRGYDIHGYDREGHYDYGVPNEPLAVPDAPSSPTDRASQVEGLKELLGAEGFPPELIDDDAFVVAQMEREAAGLPPLTPEEYAALDERYFTDSLYQLWYDLDARVQAWENGNGLDDEPIDDLLAKRKQVEDYLNANEGPGRAPTIASEKPAPKVAVDEPKQVSPDEPSVARSALRSALEWMGEHPKIMGLVRGSGGVAEVMTGIGSALGSGGTSAPLSIPLILHGVDQIVAGGTQAVTGEPAQSGLEKVAAATGEAAGASPEKAKAIGATVDAVAGLALNLGAGAAQGAARAAASEAEALNAATKEAEALAAVAKETQVATAGEAAGGAAGGASKTLLAAEECNGTGLKRLFDSLPQKVDGKDPIAYLESNEQVEKVWIQLKEVGSGLVEHRPGKYGVTLDDGTIVTYYSSSTDGTSTLAVNLTKQGGYFKVHVQGK